MNEIDLQILADNQSPTGDSFLDELYEIEKAHYYRFLYRLVQRIQPNVVVELGVQSGRSTAHIAGASLETRVIAIDPNPPELGEKLKRYSNIDFRLDRSDSLSVLNSIPSNSVYICFVDTDHEYRQAVLETVLWRPKLKKGGIFVYDDISLNDGMKQFWTELPLRKVSLPKLHWSGFGCAILDS